MFKSLIIFGLLLSSSTALAESLLVKELRVFEPYLGTWQSDFPTANGQPAMQDVSTWERALNGTTVRTLHSINEGMYGGESLIFWDKEKQRIIFYYFTTAGFYTQGWMEMGNDQEFTAYEDVVGNQDGITQVKSTSRLLLDKMVIETQYLKAGAWTKPESRTYTRSEKTVKFK